MKSRLVLHKEYSLEELDTRTWRKDHYRTWTPQVVWGLHELGLDCMYYSSSALEPFLQWEWFLKEHFGKDAEKILANTDIPTLMLYTEKVVTSHLFTQQRVAWTFIEKCLTNDHVPLLLIDYNKIIQREDYYQWHFVVMTGCDETYVWYHESWPKNPQVNKRVLKQLFQEAWNAHWTDNDVVIVSWKRTLS